jgi:Bifunctional DNA primase/polymerase, N-terminal
MNNLQKIAAEYASHGLAVIPGLPASKEAAISWKLFQYHAPTQIEREAMFSNTNCNLNIAVVCGSVSHNLAMIDAETPKAFETQLRHCERAGLLNTWVDRSPRGGGHIALRFPVAVKPLAKHNDVEVRAQGQYVLMPPSVWFNEHEGVKAPYKVLQRTNTILEVPSLDAVHWLKLEPAAPRLPYRSLPRAVRELLSDKGARNYARKGRCSAVFGETPATSLSRCLSDRNGRTWATRSIDAIIRVVWNVSGQRREEPTVGSLMCTPASAWWNALQAGGSKNKRPTQCFLPSLVRTQ